MENMFHYKIVKEFEDVTNTDEIVARGYVRENGWDLSKALNSYLRPKNEEVIIGAFQSRFPNEAPNQLTMITWNIDGLVHTL